MTTIIETIESAEIELSSLIDQYLEFPLPIAEPLLLGIEKRIGEHPRPDDICLNISLRKKQLTSLSQFSTLRTQIKQKQLRLQQMRGQALEDEIEARKRRLLVPLQARSHDHNVK
jgi:hypothetical protein